MKGGCAEMDEFMSRKNERERRPNHRGFSMVELMIVVVLILLLAGIAIPTFLTIQRNLRVSGDSRGIADQIALAKMRAASAFTRARVYADLAANTYHIERWQKTGAPRWVTEGGIQNLSRGVRMGFGALGAAPPNTQATLAQAPACRDSAGVAIANTACVLFNSRGIPIDAAGAPTANDAIYITDGNFVYGTTISAMGLSSAWRSGARTAVWKKQ